MSASARLCVCLALLAYPIFAKPEIGQGVSQPMPSGGFKKMLFRILGFGDPSQPLPPNFNQGPCAGQFGPTTTTLSPLCPFPLPSQQLPLIGDKDFVASGNFPGGRPANGNFPGGMQTNGNFPGGMPTNGIFPGGGPANGNFPGGMQTNGNFPGEMPTNGIFPGGGPANGNFPGGMQTNGNFPGEMPTNGIFPGGGPANGNFPGGMQTNGNFPGEMPTNGIFPGGGPVNGNFPEGIQANGNFPQQFPGGGIPVSAPFPSKDFPGGIPPGVYPLKDFPGGFPPTGLNPSNGPFPRPGTFPTQDLPGGNGLLNQNPLLPSRPIPLDADVPFEPSVVDQLSPGNPEIPILSQQNEHNPFSPIANDNIQSEVSRPEQVVPSEPLSVIPLEGGQNHQESLLVFPINPMSPGILSVDPMNPMSPGILSVDPMNPMSPGILSVDPFQPTQERPFPRPQFPETNGLTNSESLISPNQIPNRPFNAPYPSQEFLGGLPVNGPLLQPGTNQGGFPVNAPLQPGIYPSKNFPGGLPVNGDFSQQGGVPLNGAYPQPETGKFPGGLPVNGYALPSPGQMYSKPLPCSALRPFIPSGFSYASIGNYTENQLTPLVRNEPPCAVLDALQILGVHKMRQLILASGIDLMFLRLNGYTLFAPLDIAFRRLPAWFISSLDTDEKLRQAFVLNHLVKDDVPLIAMNNEYLVLNDRPGPNRIRVNVYFDEFASPIYTADGARIVRGDILTANARIHLTDKVIMPNPPRNAAEYLSEKIEFEAFWNAVKKTNIEVFQSDRPITLFIPLNYAVEKMNLQAIMNDPQKLSRFVNYHVVNGTYYSSGLINSEFLTTNFYKEIKMGVCSDGFSKSLSSINGHIRVVKSDIPLLNGVAHIIEECIADNTAFYLFEESDEFLNEYGVISKRNMKIVGEEKFLNFK